MEDDADEAKIIDVDKLSDDGVLDKAEVNTILYLARYHMKNPDEFISYMQAYDIHTDDITASRKKLQEMYDQADIDYSNGKPKTEPKGKKTLLQDLKRLLNIVPENSAKLSLFVLFEFYTL